MRAIPSPTSSTMPTSSTSTSASYSSIWDLRTDVISSGLSFNGTLQARCCAYQPVAKLLQTMTHAGISNAITYLDLYSPQDILVHRERQLNRRAQGSLLSLIHISEPTRLRRLS